MFGLNFKHALLSDVYTPHHWLELVIEGNDAEKPAAGVADRLYWATDTNILYRDNGAAWIELLGGVSINVGIVFNLGLASVGTKQAQALIPYFLTISKVKVYSDNAPTGASLIVDVNKNGVTIFTTQANRPQIAIGEHADDSGTPNVVNLSAGDRLSVDCDQVGSTVAGGDDLLVSVIC